MQTYWKGESDWFLTCSSWTWLRRRKSWGDCPCWTSLGHHLAPYPSPPWPWCTPASQALLSLACDKVSGAKRSRPRRRSRGPWLQNPSMVASSNREERRPQLQRGLQRDCRCRRIGSSGRFCSQSSLRDQGRPPHRVGHSWGRISFNRNKTRWIFCAWYNFKEDKPYQHDIRRLYSHISSTSCNVHRLKKLFQRRKLYL